MPRTIEFSLSLSGIDRAIRELHEFTSEFISKCDLFVQRLAEEGLAYTKEGLAEHIDSGATYDSATVEQIESTPTGATYKITVSSEAILFLEFGNGVYAASGSTPTGLSYGPGTYANGPYGAGNDVYKGWYYYKNGTKYFTHGYSAAFSMTDARKRLVNDIFKIADEVFGGD